MPDVSGRGTSPRGRQVRVRLSRHLVALLLLLLPAARSAAQPPPASDPARERSIVAIRAALDSFIVDFNNLDAARFGARWADGASAVLPFADTPRRIDGRDAVLARFATYFAQVRSERTGPPFLFMVLRNVRIDPLGDTAALVAYEFDAAERVQRRSLVMVRSSDGAWKVLQMHGSSGTP